ncbi:MULTISPECIES: translocation/assembly module TamB domain-containing protein [Hyphobacterium]|uniref:Translocation/assembly module TamB domain-containing protein n=1 Tax=Hyphobacterium vulgare TaxID=1736751 RepID=A0ABV6ZW34_9PROT
MAARTPSLRTGLIWAAVILGGVLALLAGLRLIVATPVGTSLVAGQLDGRDLPGIGRVEIDGLEGDLLSRLRFGELTITDADGTWLELRDVSLDWRPLRYLTGGGIVIHDLEAGFGRLDRLPQGGGGGSGGSLSLTEARIDRLNLDRFELGEGIAGPEIAFTAQSSLDIGARGAVDFDARFERVDMPGDVATASFTRAQNGRMSATLDVEGAPDGPIASLLGITGHAIAMDANLAGTPDEGSGDADLRLDGQEVGEARLQWANAELSVRVRFGAQQWPNRWVRRILGGDAEGEARIDFSGRRPQLVSLVADAGPTHAEITPSGAAWAVTLETDGAQIARWSGEPLEAARVTFDGVGDLSGDRSIHGDISAEGVAYRGFSAETLTGFAAVEGPVSGLRIEFAADLAGAGYPEPRLAAILGPRPHLEGVVRRDPDGRNWFLEDLVAEGNGNRAEAAGDVRLADRAYGLSGELSLTRLGGLLDGLSGNASARVELDGGFDGALTVSLDGQARNLAGPDVIAQLGDQADLRGTLTRTAGGRYGIEDLLVRSEGLTAEGRIDFTSGNAWRADAEARARRDLVFGPVSLAAGTTATVTASPQDGQTVWRLEAGGERITTGPVAMSTPMLVIDGRGGSDDLSADIRFTAGTEQGELDLTGTIARTGESWALRSLSGTAGPVRLTGQGRYGPEGPAGRVEGRYENGPGSVVAVADFGETGGSPVSIAIDARGFQWADGRVDRLHLDAEGTLDAMDITLHSTGFFASAWTVNGEGRFLRGDDGMAVSFSPSGEWGDVELATVNRLVYAMPSNEAPRFSGAWRLNNGVFALQWQGGEAPNAELDLSDVPIGLMSLYRERTPAEGTISGRIAYRRTPAGPEIEADLRGEGLRPPGTDPDSALTARLSGTLASGLARAILEAEGNDLVAEARMEADFGTLATLAEIPDRMDTAIEGEARLSGAIGPLAAFHLPENHQLSGNVVGDAHFTGTLGAPDFSGTLNGNAIAYREIRQGVSIRDGEIAATFSGEGLDIDTLTASDGDRGTLTGSGGLSLAGGRPEGEFQLEFRNFTALDRNDLQATATGSVTIAVRPEDTILVTGETRLDRVEARIPESGRASIVEIDVTEVNAPPGHRIVARRQPSPVELDYRVRAARRIFVRGPGFDTEWGADIDVTGRADSPRLNGNARLQSGTVNFAGRPFEFESGRIRFDGEPADARLDIVAVRTDDSLTAQVRVTGRVTAPEIRLSSTPQLPEDEILSRILFGRSASELSPLEAAQLASTLSGAATGVGGFGAFDRLRSAIGIDRLSVRAGEDGPIVTGGRYIDDDVYLEIESGGGTAQTAARIEWEVRPNVTLISRLTGDAGASIAVRWRTEY